MVPSIIAVFLLCLMPGCTFISSKKKFPQHRFTQEFKHQATASCSEPIREWWKQFNNDTLNALIDEAIAANYTLAIAIEKIEQFRAQFNFKQAELLPQFDGILEATKTGISRQLLQTSFIPQDTVALFRFGFDSFWEIDFWGKKRHARDAQRYAMEAQIEDMHAIYIALIADVAFAYIQLSAQTEKKDLFKEVVALEKTLVTLEQDRFCAGLSSEIALTIQHQALAQAYYNFLQTTEDLTQTYHALAVLLGKEPEFMSPIEQCQEGPLMLRTPAVGVPSELLRRRPDIRKAEKNVAQAYELIASATAQWFPSLTLFGSTSTIASKSSNWFANESLTWNIGPQVHWPILHFGRIKATIQEQESVKRQAALEYSNTIINALKEVEDFLVGYFTTEQQYLVITEKVNNTMREELLVQDKTKSGLENELILLRAQRDRLNSEVERINTQQILSNQLISLYKALGGGW